MEIVKAFNNLVDIGKGIGKGVKKFIRRKQVKDINRSIDSHNSYDVNRIMLDIAKKREARKDE